MKQKGFTLFSTLILIFVFSILIIKIFEIKSISSTNIINQYKYIQAKNHLIFLEEYINSLLDLESSNLDSIDKIKIEDQNFNIIALIKKEDKTNIIELIVEDLNFNIRVYKKIIK